MSLPSVVHPKIIEVGGYRPQIVAYCLLTDAQALKVAMHFVMNQKLKKSDQKKLIRVMSLWDKDSVGSL